MMLFKRMRKIREGNAERIQPAIGEARSGGRTVAKICKIVLIILICLGGLGVLETGALFIYTHKKLIPLQIENTRLVEQHIRRAIDNLVVSATVRNFQLLNDGQFPTSEEIVAMAAELSSPLLLYQEETIEIKSSNPDALDSTRLPDTDTIHIWPGYVCLANRHGGSRGVLGFSTNNYSYNPQSSSYAEVVARGTPQDFAIVHQIEYDSFSQDVFTVSCFGSLEDEDTAL